MKVFHLSVECFPVAKVGGLADVVGALPKYQKKLGIDAKVVMPWYNKPNSMIITLPPLSGLILKQTEKKLLKKTDVEKFEKK